jgi:hypothetical protein
MKRRKGDLRPRKEAERRLRVLATKIPDAKALEGFLSHVPPFERDRIREMVEPFTKFPKQAAA